MAVISFVSSKGGVGKTTSAVVLAGELVAAGRKVALIDADPNRPLVAWSQLRPVPESLRLIVDDSAETIIDTIEDARTDADFVIVDLEGTATDRVGFAVARSDLVLIPLQSSVLDAAEAAKSVKLVRQMWKVANREIPYRVFFTLVPPAIRERTARDIERQFTGAAVPVLPAALIDRAAYRTLFSLGGTLHELETADVSGLETAKENAREYAQAVINAIRGGNAA
jgi:chromosome partitioning protein